MNFKEVEKLVNYNYLKNTLIWQRGKKKSGCDKESAYKLKMPKNEE